MIAVIVIVVIRIGSFLTGVLANSIPTQFIRHIALANAAEVTTLSNIKNGARKQRLNYK